MDYKNYSIGLSKGQFYQKSKTPLDGYEEVAYGEGKKTYHKYSKSIEGTLKYFDTKDVEFEGKKLQFLEVTLIDGEISNKLSVPLKNSKGNYNDEVKSIVSALNAAEVGEDYIVNLHIKETESKGKTYKNVNIYFNYKNKKGEGDKQLSTGFISFDEIPKPIKDEDEDLGTTYDFKPVNKFYAQKIKEIKDRFSGAQTPSAPSAKQEPAKTQNEQPQALPF